MYSRRGDLMIQEPVTLIPKDRHKCTFIADVIILQCIIVCIGSASILACVWTPEFSTLDYDKLSRIMYLYDSEACGYKLDTAKLVANLHISNETFGLDVLPIKWLPVIATVSTRLSAKTRKYIELSFVIHVIWFFLAIAFRIIIKSSTELRTLKIALFLFLYSFIAIIFFDLSMAVVYITHIKQSLTKGMILRYSGWSTELKLQSYDNFAGWLPIVASACWLRGIVIFMLNVYFCRVITFIRRKVKRREFKKKFPNERYLPIPEPKQVQTSDVRVLVYRDGEQGPYAKDYNPVLCVMISWLTLDCKFAPDETELHEITLMKLLYLYDPEACGRIYFYNLTSDIGFERVYTSVVWPVKNNLASSFRTKIQLWLSLHLIWMMFAVINATQGQRSCSFYATLLPFTITGVTLLVTDAVNAILFLIDARYTYTESAILRYLSHKGRLRAMNKKPFIPGVLNVEDTSWIAVLFAYSSMRGFVQWVVNYWIVKDNYFEGLERYRRQLRSRLPKHKIRRRSSSFDMNL